jgi:uncharacterized protein YndB with AHSA1/START domain
MTTLTLSKIPSMKVGLLIRTPPEQVFTALADPTLTARFWFTSSTGRLLPGARVTWEGEMYGARAVVSVDAIDENRRIAFRWGEGGSDDTHVEFTLRPLEGDATYVEVTETGFTGDGDAIVQRVVESTAGFTFVLCAMKAFVERGLELGIIGDVHPFGH